MSGQTPNRVISALTPDLSPHEVRVIALVAEGWRNHVIAAELQVSLPAVETALRRIYTKYGLDCEDDLDKRVSLVLRTTRI